jgi:hypothetical protein
MTTVLSSRRPWCGPARMTELFIAGRRTGQPVSFAPRFSPDPEYSDEVRKATYQGTVVLWVVVGAGGRPNEIKVQIQAALRSSLVNSR